MQHHLPPDAENLHGFFSPELTPILRVNSGDEVLSSTLDSRWHSAEQTQLDSYEGLALVETRRPQDKGHALNGPVWVEGAQPGQVLEISVEEVVLGAWGWSGCGGWTSPLNQALGVTDGATEYLLWRFDETRQTATNQHGDRVKLHPFPGILGVAPAKPGQHSTIPPRPTGGNLDCKALVAGTRLFLPIAVEGALFSFGDGHAAQGDGEVGGVAIECPLERLRLGIHLHPNLSLTRPRAITPTGRITFGFDASLDVAWQQALNDMVDWMISDLQISRRRAISLCSMGVDLHITQVANQVCGVHCRWNGAVSVGSGWDWS